MRLPTVAVQGALHRAGDHDAHHLRPALEHGEGTQRRQPVLLVEEVEIGHVDGQPLHPIVAGLPDGLVAHLGLLAGETIFRVEMGGWGPAREKAVVRLEGKEYVVQEGDMLQIRFNV